jgi:hypothetical protein
MFENEHKKSQMQPCICCVNGNELPDGEWCRACNRGVVEVQRETVDDNRLGFAIRSARGGDAPTQKRGFA